jgi:putative serine protease PepD
MSTTYDPFIPADGTHQHEYGGRRRAEGRDEGAGWAAGQRWEPPAAEPGRESARPRTAETSWQHEQRWEAEPRRDAIPRQRWEGETPQRWESSPRHEHDRYEQARHQHQVSWEQPPAGAQPQWQAGPPGAGPQPARRAKPLIAILVAVLLLVVGWQAYRLEQVGDTTDAMHSVIAAEQDRTARLEKELTGVFDPESVSSTVLPSVFRVRAGDFTGTAFSVGQKAQNGKSNLLTNYHVVAEIYTAGRRNVSLERGSTKIDATIVKVNKGKDLALLRADQEIKGIGPAAGQVKPGQQVVVVGAPLGLDDTVTTGVISAYRPNDPDGPTIQFDAPINPGNSGGPVVNSTNQVVGLATAKAKDAEGIGLAIPIKTACETFGGVC